MKFVFDKILRKGIFLACIFFIIFVPAALFLPYFIKVNFFQLVFTGLVLFGVFTAPITRGILQGRKKFKKLGIVMVFESIVKLVFSFLLVFLGLKVYGAMAGVIISIMLSFFISLFFFKEILTAREKTARENIYSYSKAIIIIVFAVMLMFSFDIILAKMFFSEETAGKYAVLSMLGKMIFLAIMPVSKAMFPIASEEEKKKSSSLKQSLILVLLGCFVIVGFYFIFPELIIRILFSSKYLGMENMLGLIGIAFSFLTIANLFLFYLMSSKKLKENYLFLIFPAVQILLVSIFHSSLLEFVMALIFSDFLLLIFSLFMAVKS